MEPTKHSRRRKVIYVPENYVLAMLSRAWQRNQFITVPDPVELPETAWVVGVWSDFSRNAFALVVEDESFEEVPESVMVPELQITWSTVELALHRRIEEVTCD